MRRVALVLLASAALACADRTPASRPTTPPPPAWQPNEVLRARVAGGRAGEVVIDDRDGLSPDEAALMAVERNARLRALRQQRGIASSELIAAGLLPNPRFDASLEIPFAGKDARTLGFGAGVAWNISPLLARGQRVEAAEERGRVVDLEVSWQEWQVAQAARLHTIRLAYSMRRLEAARDIESTWDRRLESLRTALQGSAVTALEVTGTERSLAEARLSRFEIEQEMARERVDLNVAIGLEPTADVQVDASWRAPRGAPAIAALLDRLPERRLDLIALRHAQHSHDSDLQAALSGRFPPLEIGVHGGRDVEEVTSGAVTLTFDLPFFDRNQASVARARAERSQTDSEYDARLVESRAELVRLARELELVDRKLQIAADAAESSSRLATLGRRAATSGGITPLAAADLEERAFTARMKQLEIEQSAAELWIGIVTESGSDERE